MIQLLIVALALTIQLCGSREAESTSVPAKLIIAHAANNSPEQ
jgi:hypothetical protein